LDPGMASTANTNQQLSPLFHEKPQKNPSITSGNLHTYITYNAHSGKTQGLNLGVGSG